MKSVVSGLGLVLGLMPSLVMGLPASAQQAAEMAPKAVVELFTSQGCSSCPPADKLFVELSRDPNLIALTFPVDYWDYLGWKDTLAHAGFTARQRQYAQARGDNTVYTPQAVVNGGMHVVGSDRAKIDMMLAKSALLVPITIEQPSTAGFKFKVDAAAMAKDILQSAARPAPKGTVYLLPIMRSTTVTIMRGENRGKLVSYANVVRGIHRIGEWTGAAAEFDVSTEQLKSFMGETGADGFVVLLQSEGKKAGKILGAARSKSLMSPAS
jgi:hypothetical protein